VQNLALSYEKLRFFAFKTVFREIIAEKLVRRRFIGRNAINIITIFNLDPETERFDARIGPGIIANLASLTIRVGSQNSESSDHTAKK
jgi:hypothetical protein